MLTFLQWLYKHNGVGEWETRKTSSNGRNYLQQTADARSRSKVSYHETFADKIVVMISCQDLNIKLHVRYCKRYDKQEFLLPI